jgi:hypothetical protein
MLAAYRKTVASVVGTFLTWAGVAYIPDGRVDRAEWFALAVAAATSLGVYAVTNTPKVAPVVVAPTPAPVKFVAPAPAPATPAALLELVPDLPLRGISNPALPGDPTAALPGTSA